MNRLGLLSLAALALAAHVACAPTAEEIASSEGELVNAPAPEREAATDGGHGDVATTDGGASRTTDAGTYPGGYECDPLENVGCPEGQACALSYDKVTREEKVACKSTEGKFCGYIFGWEQSHIIMDGRFVGMACLTPGGAPLAACRPHGADHDEIRCPLPSQFCVPSSNGIYGFCDRVL